MNKYFFIADKIAEGIESGAIKKGTKLPTEKELQEDYSCSRHTIREALDILIRRGYVKSVRGSGTYVINETSFRALDIISMKRLVGDFIKTDVLYFKKIKVNKELQESMELSKKSEIFSWKRLRTKKDKPIQLEETYVSTELFPELTQNDLYDSFYKYIEERMGYSISHSIKEIQAIVLDEKKSLLFNVKEGTPAILITQIGYLTNGKVFEYSKTIQYDMPFKHYAKRI